MNPWMALSSFIEPDDVRFMLRPPFMSLLQNRPSPGNEKHRNPMGYGVLIVAGLGFEPSANSDQVGGIGFAPGEGSQTRPKPVDPAIRRGYPPAAFPKRWSEPALGPPGYEPDE